VKKKDDKKNQTEKRRKDNKTPSNKKKRKGMNKKKKKLWQNAIKENEPKIKVLAHELLAFTLSYLMLAPWWYSNPLNLSSRTPPSLVFLCLSSHYRFVLLSHYKPVPSRAFIGYVQTISNDVA
jgi:hypothetical protein